MGLVSSQKGEVWTQTDARRGRTPRGDEGRGRVDAAEAKGHQTDSEPPEFRAEA